MGLYKWQGIKRDGARVRGSDEVKNQQELRALLRSRGIRPTKIIVPKAGDIDIGLFLAEAGILPPFSEKELMIFTRQLAVMVESGVPLLSSLEGLHSREKSPGLKMAIIKIGRLVRGGKTLSEAMHSEQGFDPLYCNLIRAGEAGGVLDEVLNKLADFLERRMTIKGKVKGAMIYPAMVVVLGTVVVMGMMMFVVPKFVDMVEQQGGEIPLPTQIVMDASHWMVDNPWTLFGAIGLIVGGLYFSFQSKDAKPYLDQMLLKLPLFNDVIIKSNLAAFARNLSTLISAGVPIVDALDYALNGINNSQISKDLRTIKKAVEEGKSMAVPMNKITYFPRLVSQMIKVGEQTGGLDKMLDKVADFFEREVEQVIDVMTKLIEPIMLVVLGGIVGFILVAMYLPILKPPEM